MKVVFVIPVYNEEQSLQALAEGILAAMHGQECSILFIDDGSTDASYKTLKRLRELHHEIEVIKFRRNFGKTQALMAGFARAQGDVVITMDADLQDDPAEIPKLLAKLDEGYDVVCGWKADRQDPWHKTVPSRVYNRFVARTFGLRLHDVNTGFKALRMEVVKALHLYGEMHRMITVFAVRLGFRVTEIRVMHHPRRFGKSKFGIERFSRGALDALTVWFLDRYQYSPGHLFGKVGVVANIFGVLVAFVGGVLGTVTTHWGSAVVLWFTGIILFLFGSSLIGLGLIAELTIARQLPPPDPAIHIEKELH